MKLKTFLLACMICALCAVQASALEYSYDGADDFLFARPTSDDTIYEEENPNVDRSKNVALVAPGFGSPTSYLPGSGEHLTPNLVPGALSGGLVNQVGGANYSVSEDGISSGMGGFLPSTSILDSDSSGSSAPPEHFTVTTRPNDTASVGFTSVTEDSYYSNGSLGTLKIPAIGLSVKIVQGTDSSALKKGVLDKILGDMGNKELNAQLEAVTAEKQDILDRMQALEKDENQQAMRASRQREMEEWLDRQELRFKEYEDTITRRFVERITVVDADTIQVKIKDVDMVIDRKLC